MKKIIETTKAPKAIGAYSQATSAKGLLFVSGQIALDPVTQLLVGESVAEQAEQVFKNLATIITAANATLADIVKMTVYLKDFSDFASLNEVMSRWIAPPYPARATVEVSRLPKDALIEIEAIVTVED